MRLKEEEVEAMVACLKHYGFQHVLGLIDERIEKMKEGMLSVPLDKDPEKSSLILLQERMKIEGAMKLKEAFLVEVKKLKEKV